MRKKPDFYDSDECDYIDVWFNTLICTMLALNLISEKACARISMTSSRQLYNTLWNYKPHE